MSTFEARQREEAELDVQVEQQTDSLHPQLGGSNASNAQRAAMARAARQQGKELTGHEKDAKEKLIKFLNGERGEAAADLIMNTIDKDHNGTVNLSEFKLLMKKLGYNGIVRGLAGGKAFSHVQEEYGTADEEITRAQLLNLLRTYGLG